MSLQGRFVEEIIALCGGIVVAPCSALCLDSICCPFFILALCLKDALHPQDGFPLRGVAIWVQRNCQMVLCWDARDLLTITKRTSPNYFLRVLTCACHCLGSVAFCVLGNVRNPQGCRHCWLLLADGICWLLISAFMLLLQKMTQGTVSPHTSQPFFLTNTWQTHTLLYLGMTIALHTGKNGLPVILITGTSSLQGHSTASSHPSIFYTSLSCLGSQ